MLRKVASENTDGLLRQYFPKGADLATYTQEELDAVAREFSGRPRQTLRWMKLHEVFARIVATTGSDRRVNSRSVCCRKQVIKDWSHRRRW